MLNELTEDFAPYRQVFYASPDFISISRLTDGMYLDVNPGFEHLTGFSRDEVIGKTSVEIGLWVQASDREKFVEALQRSGTLKEYPTQFRVRSDEILDVEFSGGVIVIRGEKILVSVVRNVTQRNRKDRELKSQREMLEKDARELAQINGELTKSTAMLEEAHKQLLESEKMAALSTIVAGVAHEINTPVGTGYTLVTHFQNKSREFSDAFKSGSMKRSDLQSFVTLSEEMSAQLATNLSHAADLIKNFKQISIDQTSEDCCHFNLKSQLFDIVARLSPILKTTQHTLEIDCPDDITMNSFKVALHKIFSNLVENSLAHAFDANTSGVMRILVHREGEKMILKFSDDGKGIPAENLPKIFDPFFTTNPGIGGSGLGLSVVFNLVTSRLRGKIECRSVQNVGTIFHMELPADAGVN